MVSEGQCLSDKQYYHSVVSVHIAAVPTHTGSLLLCVREGLLCNIFRLDDYQSLLLMSV